MEWNLVVTGHRPQHLEYWDTNVRDLYELVLQYLQTHRPTRVYVGMAIGFDTLVAIACRVLRIPYIACIPHQYQYTRWKPHDQVLYLALLKHMTDRVIVADLYPHVVSYGSLCNLRNIYMLNKGDKLLALWDPTKKSGGTYNTISYNDKVTKLPLVNLYGEWINIATKTQAK